MITNRNTSDSSSTIIRQYQNGEQSEPYDYYNNNHARVRAREASAVQLIADLPGEQVMERIAQSYRDNIAPQITKAAAVVIENALKNGMEPQTVIMAIEETGLASRPSPYYLRAILRNWAENGVVVSRVYDSTGTTKGRPWWR